MIDVRTFEGSLSTAAAEDGLVPHKVPIGHELQIAAFCLGPRLSKVREDDIVRIAVRAASCPCERRAPNTDSGRALRASSLSPPARD